MKPAGSLSRQQRNYRSAITTIGAELMDYATGKVVLRATVPFNRPEGEAHAAVAQSGEEAATPSGSASAGSEAGDTAQAGATAMILPDINGLSKLREDAFEALSKLEQMVAKPEAPDTGALAEARAEAVSKLEAAATAELPADSTAESKAMAQSMRAQADAALAVINPPKAAAPEAGSDAAAATSASEGDAVAMRDMLKQAQTALSQPADIAVAAANAPASDADEAQTGEPGEPRTIVQAPLASAPGAVIIRRGDTLWQISRRTYGQGVRYTTIYLANRSQIQDPDRIKPGQVFSVPEKPLQNAEELHRQLRDKSNR
ncbi:LysM peptidoglycan-binding domain-containing protein [Hoeflea sp. G2-23]|uniref:LysM peptidoglycan-binding domain-containing protein n=1 Tax=Hoeflea algicola TaxID=2983763 RepID=A0ABT3Z743_9HYPH|nr:LysM peptidoglycan-binding domain-containing protein [Hoeflea algicola]MCY0147596.1 LysM peptidoglycan-binding domain-containing protein [Hoeflea algicola]